MLKQGKERKLAGQQEIEQDEKQRSTEALISRRKLLASVGIAGAALAAESMFGGRLGFAAGNSGQQDEADILNGRGGDKKVRKLVQDMVGESCVQTITIAELRAMTGSVPTGFYYVTDREREGHFYYDAADTTSVDNTGTIVVSTAGYRFKRSIEGAVNVKWFGAVADYSTDNAAAFNACARFCDDKYDMYVPGGDYIINSPFIPPTYVIVFGVGATSRIHGGDALCAIPGEDIVKMDAPGQPSYRIYDLSIVGKSADNSLNGLRLGSSRGSEFRNLVIVSTHGSAVTLEVTVSGGGDVDNPTFSHIWTQMTGGVKIKSHVVKDGGGNVTGGSITDAQFRDCQFTTDDSIEPGHVVNIVSEPAIEVLGAPGARIFGVTFDRIFCQTKKNSWIKMDGGGGDVYNVYFDNMSGELWPLNTKEITFPIYYMDLKDIFECQFNNGSMSTGFNSGIRIRSCRNNVFKNFRYLSWPANKDSLLDIDENSYENCFEDLHLARWNYFAPELGTAEHANFIFGENNFQSPDRRIIINDRGSGNTIGCSTFKNHLVLMSDPEQLFQVSGGSFTHYPGAFDPAKVSVAMSGSNLRFTFAAGVAGKVSVPVSTRQKFYGARFRYKFVTTGFNGKIKPHVFGTGAPLIQDGQWHECVFAGERGPISSEFYGLVVPDDQKLTVPVTIEIEVLEVYEGYNLPYIPNYAASR